MTDDTLTRPRGRSAVLIAGWTVSAGLAVAVAASGISMDLMMAVMSLWELLGGQAVLPFAADWPGMALRLAGLGLAAAVAWGTLRYGRVTSGACRACGRHGESAVRGDKSVLARRAAWVSVVPAAGYAGLKLYWALGGTAGLVVPETFADITLASPGFADTAIMAAVGIGLVMVMAYRRPRLPRWIPLTGAAFGIALLLPVAVIGNLMNLVRLAQGTALSSEITATAVCFVYGCFAVWAAGLTVTTVAYWHDTRPRCRRCARS